MTRDECDGIMLALGEILPRGWVVSSEPPEVIVLEGEPGNGRIGYIISRYRDVIVSGRYRTLKTKKSGRGWIERTVDAILMDIERQDTDDRKGD